MSGINNVGGNKVGGAGSIGGPSSIKPADTAKGIEALGKIEAGASAGASPSEKLLGAVAEFAIANLAG